VWDRAVEWNSPLRLSPSPDDGFLFGDVSADLINPKKYKEWEKQLADFLLRHKPLMIYQSKALKKSSLPGQDEEDARIEMAMQAREARDAEVEKLQAKYATKLKSLQSRILTAEHRVQREREQAKTQQNQSLINLGASIFGALLGNKIASKSNLGKASSAARSLGRAQAQKNDVVRAEESLEELLREQHRIEEECRQEVDQIASRFSPENLKLESIEIPMRKSDLRIQLLGLLWVPYQVDSLGIARPLVDWES
jgi:phage host-nuclease inhibitor protein Gam